MSNRKNRRKGLNFVSDKGGFIFMTCPKVAGTSIRTAILKYEGEKNPKNPHSQERNKLFHNDEIVDWSHFRFSFVRNPFDRIVSCYEEKLKNSYPAFSNKYGMSPNMGFDAFVRKVRDIPDTEDCDPHIKGQTAILSLDGVLLPDWTGYFESLAEDWDELRQILRLQNELPDLPVINASTKKGHELDRYYEKDETIRLVKERYAEDLETFGYDYPCYFP